MEQQRRDRDVYDEICDHLLVLDHSRGSGAASVVGTYRLIRRDAAARLGAFYSAAEYDIAPLVAYPGEILELGRSCVDAGYRARPVMQLLWSGIAAYVSHYDIALMFGCASLPGPDPAALAVPLSYLYYHHLAPPALRARALPERFVEMRRLGPASLDPVRMLAALPPLIKGYLRLGGFVTMAFLILSPGKAGAFLGIQLALFGLYLGASFAPNHTGMPIVGPEARFDFLRRQVLMSRNISGGRWIDVGMGGLNKQIEHHLFPSMPRPALRHAKPIVEAYCREHDVMYTQMSLWRSYGVIRRYLNRTGLAARDPFTCPLVQQTRA